MSGRIAEKVKNTILEFITDLKEAIFTNPTEHGDLLLVEFFFTKMTATSVTDHIVSHVLPHKAKIQKRDIQFFIDQKREIFAGLPEERVEYFANLVKKSKEEGGMSSDDRNTIWSYFDMLILLAEEYKKKK